MSQENKLVEILLEYLERRGRGAAAELCQNTSLSPTDVSLWIAGTRNLPSAKVVEAFNWLITTERITVEIHL